MDMSGGMDMGSGLFQATNKAIAWNYWVVITAIIGVLGVVRVVDQCRSHWRYVLRALLLSPNHLCSSDSLPPEQKKAIATASWIKHVTTGKLCLSILRHNHHNAQRDIVPIPLSALRACHQILHASHCWPMLASCRLLDHDTRHALE